MTRKKPAIRSAIGAAILDEWNDPRHMTPYLPTEDPAWQEICIEVAMEAARLQEAVHPNLRAALSPLLELMNCYYSNLIEGHRTFPGEVAQALRSAQSQKKHEELVVEALAHIKTQGQLALRLRNPAWESTAAESLRWIHREFMERLPERMLWLESPGQKRLKIAPGELRAGKVGVGRHDPPLHSSLPVFLEEFHRQYRDHGNATPHALAKIAAAHHRLAWIHPFYDGNGRVARLMTDAMLERAGIGAGGLWRISRGFARRLGDYKRFLENADSPRQGSLDGRGNLTQKGLDDWCRFVIECAKDQLRFMRESIKPATLTERIRAWSRDEFPRSDHERIGLLIALLMKEGEISRADATVLLGVRERQARNIVEDLAQRGVVAAEPRGPLLPAIPLKAVPRWFPDLFPHGEDERLGES
jgi:Fic family protein